MTTDPRHPGSNRPLERSPVANDDLPHDLEPPSTSRERSTRRAAQTVAVANRDDPTGQPSRERPDSSIGLKLDALSGLRVPLDNVLVYPFAHNIWRPERLSMDERKGALEAAEERLAALDGRAACVIRCVSAAEASKWQRGMTARYDPLTNTIEIRRDRWEDPELLLSDYLHEARHAYQYDVMDREQDQPSKSPREDEQTIKMWQDARERYPTWEPLTEADELKWFAEYNANLLEIDAARFVRQMMRSLYGY